LTCLRAIWPILWIFRPPVWTRPLYIEQMFYILRGMEIEGRLKRALQAAWKHHGQGSVFTWPMVARRYGHRLPTGLPALDTATGGLPQGGLVHLQGEASSGTHVLARLIAFVARRHGWKVLCLQDPNCAASHPSPSLYLPYHGSLAAAMERSAQTSNLLIIERPLAHSPSLRALIPLLARSGSLAIVLTGQETTLPFAKLTVNLRRTGWIRRRGDIVGCRAMVLWKEGPRSIFRIPTDILFEDDPLPLYAKTA
jgi:hypothetical protein